MPSIATAMRLALRSYPSGRNRMRYRNSGLLVGRVDRNEQHARGLGRCAAAATPSNHQPLPPEEWRTHGR
jgi:hypothetical protein